jgi:hypothetical protein
MLNRVSVCKNVALGQAVTLPLRPYRTGDVSITETPAARAIGRRARPPLNPDYIALVRSGPDGPVPGLPTTAAGTAGDAGALWFLHGEGVRRALRGTSIAPGGARAVVCSTSWRRRFGDDAPPAPFSPGTLAVLLDDLASAERVDSVTPAAALCSGPPAAGPVAFELDRPPVDDRDALETLEIVLAAAALELPAGVLVTRRGRSHLDGESGRRWRQVTDLGLLPVLVDDGSGDALGDALGDARARAGRLVLI